MPSGRSPGEAVVRRFDRTGRHWDDVYSGLGDGLIRRMWNRYGRANVRSRFMRTFEVVPDLTDRRMLDLGCGTGRYLIEAVNRGAAEAVGVDLSQEMVDLAREAIDRHVHASLIQLRWGDVNSIELEGRFDLVVANGVFDYIDDPAALLARATSLCQGVLVASFPRALALRALPRLLFWRIRGVRIRFFTGRRILATAAQAGLVRCRLERIGPILLLIGEGTAV
jgi:SAM-dependent methyltransferase